MMFSIPNELYMSNSIVGKMFSDLYTYPLPLIRRTFEWNAHYNISLCDIQNWSSAAKLLTLSNMYVYIYIHRDREREREKCINFTCFRKLASLFTSAFSWISSPSLWVNWTAKASTWDDGICIAWAIWKEYIASQS